MLRETIDSLRAQTLRNAEFIIVDDRSEASVWNYLESLPASDSRFRVFRKPDSIPRGCQESRNLGFDAATADSIVFLDSDDLLAPKCLEERYKALSENDGADLVVGRQAIASGNGTKWVNIARPGVEYLDRFLNMAGEIDVPWVNGGVLIRTTSLRSTGVRWRPEFHWDDVAFHVDCLLSGMQAVALPLDAPPDSYYRTHDDPRYGSVLFTDTGLRNAAEMFLWLATRLSQSGKLTPARSTALRTSFAHFCVFQPSENGNSRLAADLLAVAADGGLVSTLDLLRIRAYLAACSIRWVSSRAGAAAGRLGQATWMKDFFFLQRASTFCSVPT